MNNKLLIHHHASAFINDNDIWIQSFIGAWVQELSKFYDEVGLLIQTSAIKKIEQDYRITAKNIRIHNISPEGKCSRSNRNKYIKEVCKTISSEYSILLIRGLTPRQKLVFDYCNIEKKSYLLVGSLNDSKPSFRPNRISAITWFVYWVRRWELKQIGAKAKLFANSPTVVDELNATYTKNASFLPTNTIRKTHFVPLSIKKIGKAVKLLFCGRVVKEKGIIELIHAMHNLKMKGINARLDIIGNVSELFNKELSLLVEELEVKKQIVFHGYVPFGNELLDFYRKADINVLPTWHEGLPHSIWEAASSCTPVIVTAVGGIPGVLNDKDVIFCKTKNANDLTDKIIMCINHPEDSAQRIKNLYNKALNYTIENCAEMMSEELKRN